MIFIAKVAQPFLTCNYRLTSVVVAGPVGNPLRSKVKGRKKKKRLKKGMNAEPKRKNKCRICRSTDHNAARCSKKVGEERVDIGSASVQQLPSRE
jgi:hypothetical protein